MTAGTPARPGPATRVPVRGGREVALVLACVALALWVHRRALGGFFALDDLVIMEEVRGLRESAPHLWRFLSRTVYFGAMVRLFGGDPFPYHLASALAHGANVALIYLVVRGRGGGPLAAGVAAGLFGASRLHVSALGAAATIGEPLALGLTLAALWLHDRGRLARLLSPVLFLAALLGKESVAFLPLVLLLPWSGAPPLRERLRRAAPLLAIGAAFALALVAGGAATAQLGGRAYARGFGANLFFNLTTYAAWVADLGAAFPGQVSAIDPRAWPAGLAAVAALALAAVVARRGVPAPAFGAAWWLLALVPVLPLLHHTYLYYLYVPLAGLAMAAGGVAAWLAQITGGAAPARGSPPGRGERAGARSRPRPGARARVVPLAAAVLVLAHALAADRLLAVRYAATLPGTGFPLDPDLRKSEVARHAAKAVAERLGGRRAKVAFLVPSGLERVYSAATGEPRAAPSDSGSYLLLAGALDDGRGLRALHPNVDTVAFLRGWVPGHGDYELFSQSLDATVFALGRGADGYAAAAAAMLAAGAAEPARRLLEGALSETPDHAPLRYEYARGFYLAGDSAAMRRELAELARRAPDHPLAARARAGLAAPGAGNRAGTRPP